jgi:hypothetical protein
MRCPYEKKRQDLLEVSVYLSGLHEPRKEKSAAELVGNMARAVLDGVVSCKGERDLPVGIPSFR